MVMKRDNGIAAMRKGPWTPEEDAVLLEHVRNNGARNWSLISFLGLLPRTGKACRLRWVNKLRPGLKKGRKFTPEEEQRILVLQQQFGNRWATIAKYFPGRTDNDVKNFWSIHRKRLARAQHNQQPSLLSTTNQVENMETKAPTVAFLQELHASEGEGQGSNSKGNSNSTVTSSAITDPQPDVNQPWINPIPDQLPQPPPFDSFDDIFDLPPLPEIHLLQPAPETGLVNLMQGQYRQSTQLVEGEPQVDGGEPQVDSINLGPSQCTGPNHQCLKCENVFLDPALEPYMTTGPLMFSPQPLDFDDLSHMFNSFEQPCIKFPPRGN